MRHTLTHTYICRHTDFFYFFSVGVLSWIIGLRGIQRDLAAVPVALAAMVNKEAHKHERQGDDHPDLSFALRGDQLRPRSSRTFLIFSLKHLHLNQKRTVAAVKLPFSSFYVDEMHAW